MRAEDFEYIYLELLKKIGYLHADYEPDPAGTAVYHKYKDKVDIVCGVLKILIEFTPKCIENAKKEGAATYDPKLLFEESFKRFGKEGISILAEFLQHQHAYQLLRADNNLRYEQWENILPLKDLFLSQKNNSETRKYLDQRYINYLSQNFAQIHNINWRKFEELTAEYFSNKGYEVEIGPGANDDGIDVRYGVLT